MTREMDVSGLFLLKETFSRLSGTVFCWSRLTVCALKIKSLFLMEKPILLKFSIAMEDICINLEDKEVGMESFKGHMD